MPQVARQLLFDGLFLPNCRVKEGGNGRLRLVIQITQERQSGWLSGLTQSGRFLLRKRSMGLRGVRLTVEGNGLISMSCLMMENDQPPEAGGVSIIGRHMVSFEFHQISNGIPLEIHWNFQAISDSLDRRLHGLIHGF